MKIIASRRFKKDIKKIPTKIAKKVKDFTLQIKSAERFEQIQDSNIKGIKGNYEESFYRLKINNYRLGFSVKNNVVYLYTLKTRGEIYKYFPPKKNKRKK